MGRTFAALLAAAAAVGLLTAAAPAMAKKSSTSRCKDVTAIGNAFVARSVRAHSTSCKNVRGKLRGWLRKGSRTLPKKKGGNWRCKRLAGGKWSCVKRRGKGSVTFKIAPVKYTVVKRAVQPPSGGTGRGPDITVGSPTANQEFAWGASAIAGYSCADASGVAQCTGTVNNTPVATGTPLPTSGAPGPGKRTLTIMAKDKAGNASTKSVDYTVKPAGYYALTYDDGPNADFTQPVLNALASVNAKATFFVVGGQITGLNQLGTQLVQAMAAGGHSVQNHTWSHVNIGPVDTADPTTPLPVDAATRLKELTDTSALIKSITGVAPTFVRPPYGMWDQSTIDAAHSLTAPLAPMEVTAWTTDTNDWMATATAQTIADAAMSVPSGGIILMHDARQTVVDATPVIVNRLRDERGMLPGKLHAPSASPQFIVGWVGALPYYVDAVAP